MQPELEIVQMNREFWLGTSWQDGSTVDDAEKVVGKGSE